MAAAPLIAANGAFEKTYGKGIHAFFSHDYAQAHAYLNQAIEAKKQDPRCFYYRGLAYLKLGREKEARSDFATASNLEARDIFNSYNVGKALERVQGKSRTIIERYRAKARLTAALRAEKVRRARYEEFKKEQIRTLQEQAQAATTQPAPVVEVRPNDAFSAGPIEGEPSRTADQAVNVESSNPFAAMPVKTPKATETTKPAANDEERLPENKNPQTIEGTRPANEMPVKPEAKQPQPDKESIDPDDPFA